MLKKMLLERKKLNELLERMNEELQNLPNGKLRVTTNHNSFQYYVDDKYISKNELKQVEQIALREYYEELKKNVEQVLFRLDKVIQSYETQQIDQLYNSMSEGRKVLLKDACYLSVEQRLKLFENEEYMAEELPYEIVTDIYTIKGEHVRSKSEKIIADELYRFGIPYKYEKPLVVYDRGKKTVLYPDFTALNKRTGKSYIVEHLGLMDQPDYVQKAMKKISLYEKNGYLLGRDLLIFHESNEEPLNSRSLRKYVEEYLL